jgi:hypothetical protein
MSKYSNVCALAMLIDKPAKKSKVVFIIVVLIGFYYKTTFNTYNKKPKLVSG